MKYTVENTINTPVDVYLDGVKVEQVFEADDDLGYILQYRTGEDGYLVASRAKKDEAVIDERHGEVKVVVKA